MKFKLTILTFVLFSVSFFSQKVTENSKNIETQFNDIYRSSSSYQNYKVIRKERFNILKINVIDSIDASKKSILEKETLLNAERETIKRTKKELTQTQNKLEAALTKENSISLFGKQLSKISYKLIVWTIIIVLLFVLFYFAYQFKNSHILTKKAKTNLEDVALEFELYRKKALAKEQKLRRQLQDEINKQRNP